MPVAVVIEAAGLFEHAGQFHAARPHVVDVRLRAGMAVLKGPLLLRLSPKDLVVAVAVEGRVDVDQVDAALRQLRQLLQVVAAVDDARIDQRRRSFWSSASRRGGGSSGLLGGRLAGHGGPVYEGPPASANLRSSPPSGEK